MYSNFNNLFFVSESKSNFYKLTFHFFLNNFNNKQLTNFIKYFFNSLKPSSPFFKNSINSNFFFLTSLRSFLDIFNSNSKIPFFLNNNFNIFFLKNNFYSKTLIDFKKYLTNFIFYQNRTLNPSKIVPISIFFKNTFFKDKSFKSLNLRTFKKSLFLIKLMLNLRMYFLLNRKTTKLIGGFFKIRRDD